MIIAALNDYFDREMARGTVPPLGYAREPIAWVLVLAPDGSVIRDEDIRQDGRPVRLVVPIPQARGTSKITPRLAWGKPSYVLGVGGKRPDREHAEWAEYQKNALREAKHPALQALKGFCERWVAGGIGALRYGEDIAKGGNIAFRLDGSETLVHDLAETRAIWVTLFDATDSPQAACLVNGKRGRIAPVHPDIMIGGSGAKLVSANDPALEHYGHKQANNAPISIEAAHGYTAGLNRLLSREYGHRVGIGDTTAVFWAEAGQDNALTAEALLGALLGAQAPVVDDAGETARIRAVLERVAAGRPLADAAPDIDPSTRYCLLGLGQIKARVIVRFWHRSTLGDFAARVGEHYGDMRLEPRSWKTPPSVWRLARATVREGDDPKPNLATDMLRAILTGQRYPQTLLATILSRFRADKDINGLRVALLKACLARDYRLGISREDVPVTNDPDNPSIGYQLGRLFATLEGLQRAASPGINTTLRDKYYSTASALPGAVFPQLLRGVGHYTSTLRRQDKGGLGVWFDRQIAGIAVKIGTDFPPVLSPQEQGRFALGYYHALARKQDDAPKTNDNASEAQES